MKDENPISISNRNKTIAKNTVYLYIRLVFAVFIGLIISRVVLKTLGVEDFGIYNLVGGFVSLLLIFTFSISGTCRRFLLFELGRGDNKRLSDTFCTISILLIVFAVIFFIMAGIFGSWIVYVFLNIPEDKKLIAVIVFLCSLFIFCIQLLAIPYTSLVVAHEKMDFYAIMSVAETLLKLLLVLSLYYISSNRLIVYALSLTIICAINLFVYYLYCKAHFIESTFKWVFDKNIFKNIFSFTFWVGVGSGAGLLKDQGGSILMNMFFGVILNAACGIANQVRSVVMQLTSNIGLAVSPQITKSYSSGDRCRSISLTFFLAKIQTLFVLVLAIPIFLEAPRLLNLWLGEVPEYTVEFVRCIMVFAVLQTLEQSSGPLFLAIGKVKKYQLKVSLIILTVLPVTYLCYRYNLPPYSYYLICSIVEFVVFVYCYIFLVVEVDFPIYKLIKDVLVRIIIVCIITFSFVYSLKPIVSLLNNEMVQMLFNIVLCLFLFLTCSYYIAFKEQERQVLNDFIKKSLIEKIK